MDVILICAYLRMEEKQNIFVFHFALLKRQHIHFNSKPEKLMTRSLLDGITITLNMLLLLLFGCKFLEKKKRTMVSLLFVFLKNTHKHLKWVLRDVL